MVCKVFKSFQSFFSSTCCLYNRSGGLIYYGTAHCDSNVVAYMTKLEDDLVVFTHKWLK